MPITDAYADASGYQHTIVATADSNVHELWWTAAEVLIFNPANVARHPGGTRG
jgi:hypothetical protein